MLRINIISIIGAVIALIGLALPWWTITYTVSPGISIGPGMISSYSASIYTYQTTSSGYGYTVTGQMDLWYGWAAFTLLVLGALLAIAFSLIPRARALLALGGALSLLSVIVFAAGLQNDLSTTSGLSGIGLLSSGTTSVLGVSYNYTTYLSIGFWLTLVGAIVMLVASLRKPKTTAPTAVPPPPTQQEPSTPPS
jgi:phosphoglycerol transferase MdoB-like AlkP superfamily enzyme